MSLTNPTDRQLRIQVYTMNGFVLNLHNSFFPETDFVGGFNDNDNNNIYLKSSIQTSSIDYKKYYYICN